MKQSVETATVQILEFLGKFRTVTETQIKKLLGDTAATSEALAALIKLRRIGRREIEIKAAGGRVTVLYLHATGCKIVRQKFPHLEKHARPGMPAGTLVKRLYHGLLVVEVLIYFNDRADITGFYTEDELKRRGEKSADLRVITLTGEQFTAFDCEVIGQHARAQISVKDPDLLYFTPARIKAGMIEFEKKAAAHLIGLDVNLPENTAPARGEDDQLHYECWGYLASSGLALTAAALACLLKIDRAKTLSALRYLEGRQLFSEIVHLEPGIESGCPAKLYSTEQKVLESYSDRIYYLLCSKLIEKACEKGVELREYNLETRTILFQNGAAHHLIYIDDPYQSLTGELVKFAGVKDWFFAHASGKCLFAASNTSRLFELLTEEIEEKGIEHIDLVFAKNFRF